MKYKTLIEKNSEPNLTEGCLTTPPSPHPRFASTTLLPLQFPLPPTRLLPTRQRCIYAGQEDRGELEKNACAENTIQACGAKSGAKTCEWASSCLVVARALSAVAW